MKTYAARLIAPVVVIATLAWAVPCPGQDLNIEIPVPEPGRGAAEGKDAGRRKHSQRNESPQGARRNARPPLAETPPALDLDFGEELQVRPGTVSEEPMLAPPKNKSSRPWPASVADEGPEREPAWANPAGIPLRQERHAETAPTAHARDEQPLVKAPPAGKTSKSRGEGKATSGHSGWLSRWFQSSRRDAQTEEPPLLARRQRATGSDPTQGASARPSPRSKGRQAQPDRE